MSEEFFSESKFREFKPGIKVKFSEVFKNKLAELISEMLVNSDTEPEGFKSIYYYTDYLGYEVTSVNGEGIKISASGLGDSEGFTRNIKILIESKIFKFNELELV